MPLLAPYRALFCFMHLFSFMIHLIVFVGGLLLLFAIPFVIALIFSEIFGTLKRNKSDCP